MTRTIRFANVETNAERIEVVELLYESNSAFVPITPLAVLQTMTTFYKATEGNGGPIRAASSFEEWLEGCDRSGTVPCTVYELASSIVRSPMGGFDGPSLQQVFAFVRLVAILDPYVAAETRDSRQVCVMASVAAGNERSLQAMRQLGMQPLKQRPRWLDYEHRAWFPMLTAERPQNEAVYLWLSGPRARAFLRKMAPYAAGKKLLRRPSVAEPGRHEEFSIEIAIAEYEDLVERFGDIEAAIDQIPYHIFAPPPDLARLPKDYDSQPMRQVSF